MMSLLRVSLKSPVSERRVEYGVGFVGSYIDGQGLVGLGEVSSATRDCGHSVVTHHVAEECPQGLDLSPDGAGSVADFASDANPQP